MNRTDKPENDEIRDLIAGAGRPEPIPAADLTAIKNAARREFLARGGSPVFKGQSGSPIVESRRSYRPWMAIAATLLLALTAVWLFRSISSPVATTAVATVELLRGEDAAAIGLDVGQSILAGAEIDTATAKPSLVALRMASGHSVRLHANSKVRLDSGARIELERGALYVDSGADGASSSLEIVTPHGSVREIGTQYEVRLSDDERSTMRVRVREGSIALSRAGDTFSAARGEQLTVDASGTVDRTSITGSDWSWAIAVAPAFDADGRTLEAYLTWVSRETGLQIVYSDPRLEVAAAVNTLVGSPVAALTPEETLSVYLPGSGLDYRIEGDLLVISGLATR